MLSDIRVSSTSHRKAHHFYAISKRESSFQRFARRIKGNFTVNRSWKPDLFKSNEESERGSRTYQTHLPFRAEEGLGGLVAIQRRSSFRGGR